MSKGLFFLTILGVGAAAVYLSDEKYGKKRRAKLRKQIDRYTTRAGEWIDDYVERAPEISRDLGGRAQEYLKVAGEKAGEYSREYGPRAQEFARVAGSRAGDYLKNGHSGWRPSARFVGALGSAIAFYGAGRPGIYGTLLRTLSLGIFTRALMTSR
jgi:hypothetical protein